MLTTLLHYFTFLPIMSAKIKDLHTTVIQMLGLVRYKTRFNPTLST